MDLSVSCTDGSKKFGGLKEGEISWGGDKKNRANESLSHQMSDFGSQELILTDQIVTHVYRKATDSGRHKILTSILLMVQKSCTTWDVKNPMNNRMSTTLTG